MSTNVMRADAVIGLPVVAIDSGEDVAEIRDVVYDAAEHRLVGFTLNKRGFFAGRLKDVLPAADVTAIGADAVMIQSEESITHSATPETLESSAATVSVIGSTVMSADGNDLGDVIGVIIATGNEPAAVGYEIAASDGTDEAFVPISAQIKISGDNLMLPEGATDFVRHDLAGFGAAVLDYRRSTLEGEAQ